MKIETLSMQSFLHLLRKISRIYRKKRCRKDFVPLLVVLEIYRTVYDNPQKVNWYKANSIIH